jgi:outer membrane protein assembly factor BamB
MKNPKIKKTLVYAILFLFIGSIVTPTISGLTRQTNDFKNIGEIEFKNLVNNEEEESSPTTSAEWWPMWRHSPGNDGSTTSIAPNTNQLNWKEKISDEIYSTSPVISDNNLFISTGYYYDWYNPSKDIREYIFNPPDFSEVLSDLVDYKEEYFGGLYCMDAETGANKWSYPLYAPNDPLVINDKVYVTDMNIYSYASSLYCLDADNGNNIWDKSVGGIVTSPTVGGDNKIFLGILDYYSYNSALKCYDNNGAFKWSYNLPATEVMWFSAPAYDDGKVYFISANFYSYFTGKIYCLDAETGEYIWSQVISTFFLFQSSPVCRDDKVYIVDLNIYSYSSSLRCYNADSGNLLWQYPMSMSICFGTPAVNQDSAFIAAINLFTYSNYMYKVRTDTGTLVWQVPIPGISYFFSSSTPTVSANKVFIAPWAYDGYSNSIYCLSLENGNVLWSYSLDYNSLAYPSIADERLYTADNIGNVYAIEDLLKISKVSGGLLSVKAKIANIGVEDFSEVSWEIDVVGGMMDMIDKHSDGEIPTLKGGKSKTVRAFPIMGMGNVDIQVMVSMTGVNPIIKNLEGMVIGLLVIIKS